MKFRKCGCECFALLFSLCRPCCKTSTLYAPKRNLHYVQFIYGYLFLRLLTSQQQHCQNPTEDTSQSFGSWFRIKPNRVCNSAREAFCNPNNADLAAAVTYSVLKNACYKTQSRPSTGVSNPDAHGRRLVRVEFRTTQANQKKVAQRFLSLPGFFCQIALLP